MNPILDLPNVTVLCIDCVQSQRVLLALNECVSVGRFGSVKFLTSLPCSSEFADLGVEVIRIPPIQSLAAISKFLMKHVADFVETEFMLHVHWDGYIINPLAWDNGFFEYDYIGARWLDGVVGNGGFSLRSRRLLQFLQRSERITELHPEDHHLCRTYAGLLQSEGFRIAPPSVAHRFSVEWERYVDQLGFHNFKTIATKPRYRQKNVLRGMTLDELAITYGTDKSSLYHDYARTYEYYFAGMRQKQIKLLEIGVGSGASLRMWQDFFACGTIIGLDKDAGCANLEGLTVRIGDQSDEEFLRRVGQEAFDIIVDDASHYSNDQIASFRTLFPLLNAGGHYVIEDLHTSYWGWGPAPSAIDFLRGLLDDVNCRGKLQYAGDRHVDRSAMVGLGAQIKSVHFYRSLCIIHKADA